LSLWLNRVQDSTKPLLPPYPHPPPKARGFIKPLVLPMAARFESQKFHSIKQTELQNQLKTSIYSRD
jgi:hypothetical protein